VVPQGPELAAVQHARIRVMGCGPGRRGPAKAHWLITSLALQPVLEDCKLDALLLERTPQPLNHDVVHPASLAIRGDVDEVMLPSRKDVALT